MPTNDKDYHTNDTSLGRFYDHPAAFETDTNHVDKEGNQLHDIFYSKSGDPYGPGHGHVVTDDKGDVQYWRDTDGEVLVDNDI